MTTENNSPIRSVEPTTEGKMLKITLLRSTIRSRHNHKATIRSLNLHRINDTSVLPDNPAIRGMIETVRQWVKFEEV